MTTTAPTVVPSPGTAGPAATDGTLTADEKSSDPAGVEALRSKLKLTRPAEPEKTPEAKPEPPKGTPDADHAANLANLARETRKLELARREWERKSTEERAAFERERAALERERAENKAAMEEVAKLKRAREMMAGGKRVDSYREIFGDPDPEMLKELLESGGEKPLTAADVERLADERAAKLLEEREKAAKEKAEADAKERNDRARANQDRFVWGEVVDPNGPADDLSNRQGGVAGYLKEHQAEYPAVMRKGVDPQTVIKLAQECYAANKFLPDPKTILDFLEEQRKAELRADAEELGIVPKADQRTAPTSIGAADKRGADIDPGETDDSTPRKSKREESAERTAASRKAALSAAAETLALARKNRK